MRERHIRWGAHGAACATHYYCVRARMSYGCLGNYAGRVRFGGAHERTRQQQQQLPLTASISLMGFGVCAACVTDIYLPDVLCRLRPLRQFCAWPIWF